jgi:hypothetical protein
MWVCYILLALFHKLEINSFLNFFFSSRHQEFDLLASSKGELIYLLKAGIALRSQVTYPKIQETAVSV